MKMVFLTFATSKQNCIYISIIVWTLILSIDRIKCQEQKEVFESELLNRQQSNVSVTPVIVVVTDTNEKGSNCDERKSESKHSNLFSGILQWCCFESEKNFNQDNLSICFK